MKYRGKEMTHAEVVPLVRAETEAWRAEHGTALKARDEMQRERREKAKAVYAGLTDEQREALDPFLSL